MDLDDKELEATREALQEVKLHKEGKLELDNWEDFKQELKIADEMFADLGYEKIEDSDYFIIYKSHNEGIYSKSTIQINKTLRNFVKYDTDPLWGFQHIESVSIQELQAINKKYKELRWIK